MKKSIFLMLLLIPAGLAGQYTTKGPVQNGTYRNDSPYPVVKIKPSEGRRVRNVILMIGDGMGLDQVSAAWVANHGRLNLDNCMYTGFSRTWSADSLITDSGAAGSAMATGHKTKYHAISVDQQGNPLSSLTDLAHDAGLKTGIVVTCNLPDATPSAFCANNTDRNDEEDIAADYLSSNVDFIFGGGREEFSRRKDGRNILEEMKQKGYQVFTSWEETEKATGGKVFSVPVEGQFPLAAERGDLFAGACRKSLDILSQEKKGFFAMFEGSRIDDCGHSNNLPRLMEEVFDFDKTIGMVLEWAEKDGHTLVVILSDHETGGLSLLGGSIEKGTVSGSFSTGGHSGIMVPVYAWGPGSSEFTGIYENTGVFERIVKLLKLKN